MPNHCTSCGAELAEGTSFCAKCGARAALDEASAKNLFKRPGLITFLAVLKFIGGSFALLGAVGMALAGIFVPRDGDAPAGAFFIILAVLYVLFGVLYLVCGYGLWKLKSYGRTIARILAWIGLIGIPIGTIISILILLYLYKPGIKILFSGRNPRDLSPEEVRQIEEVSKSSTGVVVAIVALVVLIGIAIMGIIAAIAIPNLLDAMNRARFKRTEGDIRAVATAVEAYKVDNEGIPPLTGDFSELKPILEGAYIAALPQADAWGNPFGYSAFENEEGGVSYNIWSGGADGVFEDATSGIKAQDSRNWNCDTLFQDGMFLFGECR